MSENGVLVIGGGVAGIQASLDLANSDIKVYLVERTASIGGRMAQLDKTFPTNDCAMCILSPKLVEVGRHPNIQLMTLTEVTSVEGEAGNFTVKLYKKPRYVDEKKCIGCGICAEKCPSKVPSEYNMGLDNRKAIYIPFPQAVPLVYAIDKEHCIYFKNGKCRTCERFCGAKAIDFEQKGEEITIKVGAIIVAEGYEPTDARQKKEYMYGHYRNVLTSMEFERMLSASGPFCGEIKRPSDGKHPKKIAFISCVGSRDEKRARYCSAVCCMFSAKEAIIAKEHSPDIEATIFYMDMRAFGKEFEDYYKRAKEVYGIRYERCRASNIIEEIPSRDLIITYRDSKGEYKKEKFDLVVLSTGLRPFKESTTVAKILGIDTDEYGFCRTSEFSPLETTREGILVCGAYSGPKDIPDAVAEGSGAASKASAYVYADRGKYIRKVEYPPEKEIGREPRIGVIVCNCGINIGSVVKVPEVVEYSKRLPNVVHAEEAIYACSQDFQKRIGEMIREHSLNRLVVASCTPRTHEPLFRNTLRENGLNPYLFEMANIREHCSWIHRDEPVKATEKAKDLVRMAVAKAARLEPLSRAAIRINPNALVIGGGVSGMTAALELSSQGFHAYLVEKTNQLGGNLIRIPFLESGEETKLYLDKLIEKVKNSDKIELFMNAEIESIDGYVGNFKSRIRYKEGELNKERILEHGVIIVATGASEYKSSEYCYGLDTRVVTQLELDAMLASGKEIKGNVVMIGCVGSRTKERGYCSRVCCTHAMKNAVRILSNKDTNVYYVCKDVRTYGFNELVYKQAVEKGLVTIRYDDENLPKVEVKEGRLSVQVFDDILGRNVTIKADYVVLGNAIIPNQENSKIAKMLKVPLTKDGFFLEAHMKLRPVDFATEGIYVCGLAHSPKFLRESIAQACAASARAATLLSKSNLESEGIIAVVNDALCDGCGICAPICDYKAIEIVDDIKDNGKKGKKIAKINEGLCKGCGACVGACPSGAMEQKGFKNVQLIAMIDSALEEWRC